MVVTGMEQLFSIPDECLSTEGGPTLEVRFNVHLCVAEKSISHRSWSPTKLAAMNALDPLPSTAGNSPEHPGKTVKAGGSSPPQVGSGGRLWVHAVGAGRHGSLSTISSGIPATQLALKKRNHFWSDWLLGIRGSWMIALSDVLLMLAVAGLSSQPIPRGSAAVVAAHSRRSVQMPSVVQVDVERSSAEIRHQRLAAVLSAIDAP